MQSVEICWHHTLIKIRYLKLMNHYDDQHLSQSSLSSKSFFDLFIYLVTVNNNHFLGTLSEQYIFENILMVFWEVMIAV